MPKFLALIDQAIIKTLSAYRGPISRLALFLVYFWFGALKVIGESPANSLVARLLEQTLPFMTFSTFIILFGLYEMLIGVLWLVPRGERAAIALLLPHLITTCLPLFLLPELTWSAWLIPTLGGQYIIKNIVIAALALSLGSRLQPWPVPYSSAGQKPF